MKAKNILIVLVAVLMSISTLIGVSAFELDTNEDTFVLSPGDTTKGAFIVENSVGNVNLNTDFAWLSLSEDEMLKDMTDVNGQRITDGAFSVPYFIIIPDDAEIGIYRTVIEVTDGIDTEYLNVKISVQNGLISALNNAYQRPLAVYLTYLLLGCVLFLFLVYFYMRSKN